MEANKHSSSIENETHLCPPPGTPSEKESASQQASGFAASTPDGAKAGGHGDAGHSAQAQDDASRSTGKNMANPKSTASTVRTEKAVKFLRLL
ncbi:hypothetical protein SMACR_08220 [Sordaria macrospora]|uniref:WGS project CABT00000000 data, contig 2.43 n=2 Tax=Sordaria macrospora TaxID=5147 RepID=F7W871_SORMK|nr:uncharacterized protein SMAC_08220 [Sordaria macrospora k-hell]KAA8628337.1 hypothetical protein SMACR_08220 [Sordaria macrospora]KAH7632396.1 hypothetical protein B0T09DRAFT_258404 [Sordaria sp. MPI-SDFR-AT-0083]KAH7632409.1 hypothetical protein B0T09DRAFT_354558 [Sordaria sp. MPI-SDFR-AT-0083]WPJ61092.1 hypothetical protein SMAC4_08220 [Sordaria macrospora]CCC13716.1 unnamed protein product [Sordaria macrospora k-hell]